METQTIPNVTPTGRNVGKFVGKYVDGIEDVFEIDYAKRIKIGEAFFNQGIAKSNGAVVLIQCFPKEQKFEQPEVVD